MECTQKSEEMKKIWRIQELLKWGEQYFFKKGIEQPRLNMEFLLSHVLKKKRIELYLCFAETVDTVHLELLKSLIKRRVEGEPLMYILEETQFFGCQISVNSSVLIPRPETESMVDEIARSLGPLNPSKAVDLGTGSGCIAIALAKLLPETCQINAVDLSTKALETAKANAYKNDLDQRIDWIHEDMTVFLKKPVVYDLIVSNPPYISLKEYENLDESVKQYEPRNALTDEKDGTFFLQTIINFLPNRLSAEGMAFLEFGSQMEDWVLKKTGEKNLKGKIFKDIHNIPRFIKITFH